MSTTLSTGSGLWDDGRLHWGIDATSHAIVPNPTESGLLDIGASDAKVGQLWVTNFFGTGQTLLTSTKGATWKQFFAEEELTLATGGTTTDSSANLLPANSIILAVSARITVGITTASNWSVGDSNEAARFIASQSGAPALALAYTVVGLDAMAGGSTTTNLGPTQAAAAKVRVTTDVGVGAGKIRVCVMGLTFAAPTS